MSSNDHPHRRLNRLTGEWVLVSPHRSKRPWQGERGSADHEPRENYRDDCYLCAGNERASGASNSDYRDIFVFPNDFPALLETPEGQAEQGLFASQPVAGEARVICYSPDHSATLARIDNAARRQVVDGWCDLSEELGARWQHVQIFENKGAMMGASSPHPHGQVWASDFMPDLLTKEDNCQAAHLAEDGTNLLSDVAALEVKEESRVIHSCDHWLAVVPFWAAWPFEILLIARQDVRRLEDLDDAARAGLSRTLGHVLGCYDNLFDTDFPYSMGWHGAPHGLGDDCGHWRLHAHFYPPLLRSATIRKHMVGYELLAETQRDLTAEQAAERLRAAAP